LVNVKNIVLIITYYSNSKCSFTILPCFFS